MNSITRVHSRSMFRRVGYGLIAWTVPYATSLLLLSLIQRDPEFFRTIMVVEGSLVGALLTVLYFEAVTSHYLREGFLLAATWIVVNWALDMVGVVPFVKLSMDRYFLQIGFEYLRMFAPTLAVGYMLERRLGGSRQA